MITKRTTFAIIATAVIAGLIWACAAQAPIDSGAGDEARPAKIVTVGGSTTAVLGMMAGYGIADRAAAMKPSFADPATTAPPIATPNSR